MSKEEIEDLERRLNAWKRGSAFIRSADGDAALVPPTTLPMAMAALTALPRLLEERKRLLEALRPFTEGANSIMFRKAMLEAGLESHVKEVQAAADAVAFAEEPAR